MKLKLACADFTFPLLSHDQSLDLIATLGFEGVDIGLFQDRGHLQPSTELRNLSRSARDLARKLSSRGLKLADMYLIPADNFTDLAPNHPNRRVRDAARAQFQKVVEYTLRVGGKHLGGLPGIHWQGESSEDSLKRSSDELKWRADYAREHGIIYSVEPHVGSVISSPPAAEKLVRMTPGLTLTLDYCHFTTVGLSDSAIEPLVKYASHFHCRGARKGRLQASFKENTIDYGRVLWAMRRTGYSGYIGVEYVWVEWEHCNDCDNLSETVLFRDFLRKAWRN